MSTVRANWLMLEGSSFSVDGFSRMWLVAAATYGVGDIVTTIAIVYFMPTLTEANPAIRLAIQTFGGGGFLGLKLLVLPRLYRNQSLGRGPRRRPRAVLRPPAVLTLFGIVVTGMNLGLLFA